MFVLVDTEYTTWPGALESGWTGLGQHREIVQIAAVKVSDDYLELAAFDAVVLPTRNPILSGLFIELTGITQALVDKDGKSFAERLQEFEAFCEGGRLPVVCYNADESVFRENCSINGLSFPFERSWGRLRPFLEGRGIDMAWMSSGRLHELTPKPLIGGHVHNALHDVRSMVVWMRHAAAQGYLPSVADLPSGAPDTDPRSLPRP